MAYLEAIDIDYNSIQVALEELDADYTGKRIFAWYLNGILKKTADYTGSITQKTYTFGNLQSNTEYHCKVKVTYWSANGHGNEMLSAEFDDYYTTLEDSEEPEPEEECNAYIANIEPYENSVTVTIKGLEYGNSVYIYISKASTNESVDSVKKYDTSTTLTHTFYGLAAGTRYYIDVYIVDYDCSLDSEYFTTSAPVNNRPQSWSWSSTVSNSHVIKLSAIEWNSFTSRINEFRVYKNMSPYSFTTVVSGTKISTFIVNQARTAINDISGHGTLPSPVIAGDGISASFFNGLMNALNAIS